MKLLCALSVLAAANSFTIAPSPQLSRTVVQLSQEPEQVPEPEEEPEFEPTPVEEETFEPTPVEDFEPTPVEDFEPTPVEEVEPVAIDEPKIADGEALVDLLRLASSTGRGEFATASQKDRAAKLIENLEFSNPTANPTDSPLIQGTWELVYSSTQLFRSSPFFMAGRAVCETEDQAKQYDWFCDMHRGALAISNIGAVRQIISATRMVSEFEVKAGAVPFLSDFTPFAYSGGWPVSLPSRA